MWAYSLYTAPVDEELSDAAERHRVLIERAEQIRPRSSERRRRSERVRES